MQRSTGNFGKYRELAIAAAFFLVFDLGVLVLNFYTSYQVAEKAAAINIAGQQRMLSQNISMTLLHLQDDVREHASSEKISTLLADLELGMAFFSETLRAFQHGGTVHDANSEQITLAPVSTAHGQEILAEADRLWQGYHATLTLVQDGNMIRENELATAVAYAKINNSKLLELMNALSSDLQVSAAQNAQWLRTVQTIGITLALFNFVFILFKFIRRLQAGDAQIELAQKETQQILSTVREGLFLLDPQLKFGSQHSGSMHKIFQRELQPGMDFMPILREMVSDQVFEATEGYVELLFGNRVKESLVTSLNPLSEVEVRLPNNQGELETRFLAFQFNRVAQEDGAPHLLVTVQDVTERVLLVRELSAARNEARLEVDVMLRMLTTEPKTLRNFIDSMEDVLKQINQILREVSERKLNRGNDYVYAINQSFRLIHACKGEASLLGLDMLESGAHEFEQALVEQRNSGQTTGEDLIDLSIKLNALFERVSMVRDVTEQISQVSLGKPVSDTLLHGLESLAERIANAQKKEVEVSANLEALDLMPPNIAAEVRQIAIQLMRNAVTHGIEVPDERREQDKPVTGLVQLHCQARSDGSFHVSVRDDGRGLSAEKMRIALRATGKVSEEEVSAMNEQQLIMCIFDPGFSTAEHVDQHAGRGMGMDVVMSKVRALGGKLSLKTRIGQYTEFSIRIPATERA